MGYVIKSKNKHKLVYRTLNFDDDNIEKQIIFNQKKNKINIKVVNRWTHNYYILPFSEVADCLKEIIKEQAMLWGMDIPKDDITTT